MNQTMNFINKKRQTENGINYLNIGLMILSAGIAFYLPFHLFLFVYAVLGPLHYLTEISWLEKKNFFIPNKKDIILYVVISLIIFLSLFKQFEKKISPLNTALMITSFVFAFLSVIVKNNIIRFLFITVLFFILVSLKVNGIIILLLIFSVLLPTLIHVYVFTGLFILFGALKSKRLSGFLSLLVFLACSIFFFIIIPPNSSAVSDQVKKLFDDFRIMNQSLLYILNIGEYNTHTMSDFLISRNDTIYNHRIGIAVMRFIAFAYCYHYLNWFSKTSIIKWHNVSKQRMFLIIFLWVISVTLYAVKYKIGFTVLFTLSMLHVFCEFPLNIQTFKGIVKEFGEFRKGRQEKIEH
jgi:hypothetical protein